MGYMDNNVRSQRCDCLGAWAWNQLIARPGDKGAASPWPDPYICSTLLWTWIIIWIVYYCMECDNAEISLIHLFNNGPAMSLLCIVPIPLCGCTPGSVNPLYKMLSICCKVLVPQFWSNNRLTKLCICCLIFNKTQKTHCGIFLDMFLISPITMSANIIYFQNEPNFVNDEEIQPLHIPKRI